MLQMNPWGGGGWYCEDGNKAYCCEVPQGKNNECYWSGMGNECKSGDLPLVSYGHPIGAAVSSATAAQ